MAYEDNRELRELVEKLRESEQKYRDLFENANDLIVVLNMEGVIEEVNRAVEEKVGLSREKIVGRRVEEFIHPDFHSMLRKRVSQILETKRSPDSFQEYRVIDAKGETFWVEGRGRPILKDGKVVGIQVIMRDVTQRKRAEEALRESEEKYRSLVENSHTGIYIIQDGVYKFVNQKLCEITGYSKEELIGMDFRRLIAPESSHVIEGSLKRQRGEAGAARFEFKGLRKDGERRDALVYSVPIIYKGKPAVQGNLIDITDIKRAQEKLKMLASIVENVSEAICSMDLEGRITYWNAHAETLFGYAKEEIIGKHISVLVPEDRKGEVEYCMKLASERGYISGFETERVKKNGERFPVELTATALRDDKGEIKGFISIMRDITQRKRAEEELHRRLDQLQTIYHMADAVSRAGAIDEIYEEALNALQRTLKADRAAILLFDQHGVMRFKAWRGLSEEYRKAVEGHSPWSPKEKKPQPILIPNVAEDSSLGKLRSVILREGIHAMGFIPLVYQGKLLGKFMSYYNKPHRFSEEEVQLAQTIASHIAFVIERKRAEEALRESEEKYRELFENANDLIVVFNIDGVIEDVNRAVEETVGLSRDKIVGRRVADFIHPDFHNELRERVALMLKIKSSPESFQEYRIVDAKGRTIWVEARGRPILKNGEVVGIQAIMRDITQRKRAEEALRESEEKYRTLIDSALDSIFLHDLEGNILEVNRAAAERLGYAKEELLNMKIQDIVPEERRSRFPEIIKELLEKKSIFFESDHLRRDGTTYPVEVSARLMEFRGKKVVLAISRDVTQRKQMERQIIISEKLASLGVLAAGIAHELNNPLNNIYLLAQLIKEDMRSGKARKEDVEMILQQVQRASNIIRGLLEFSREGFVNFEEVDINAAIEEMLGFLGDIIERHRVRVVKKLEAVPKVAGDKTMLQQVLVNLITNACHAMPRGGEIRITTRRRNGVVEIQISDTGVGIKKEHLSRIFDPFFTTKERNGTGLGLAVSHSIIKRHGGEISVESEPGKGSTFRIVLPALRG
jgi:PAS domain S-box-containing protein